VKFFSYKIVEVKEIFHQQAYNCHGALQHVSGALCNQNNWTDRPCSVHTQSQSRNSNLPRMLLITF
jgi:hypothetical protein